jgi:hypothetical protein
LYVICLADIKGIKAKHGAPSKKSIGVRCLRHFPHRSVLIAEQHPRRGDVCNLPIKTPDALISRVRISLGVRAKVLPRNSFRPYIHALMQKAQHTQSGRKGPRPVLARYMQMEMYSPARTLQMGVDGGGGGVCTLIFHPA